jgi:hypothetical protein
MAGPVTARGMGRKSCMEAARTWVDPGLARYSGGCVQVERAGRAEHAVSL